MIDKVCAFPAAPLRGLAQRAGARLRQGFSGLLLASLVLMGGSASLNQALALDAAPKSITVVVDDNYPPFIFRDASGQLQGILKDSWALWQAHTGIAVDLQAMDWARAQQLILAGQADVIDTMFQTPARQQLYEFSVPYAQLDVPIFFHKSISGITNADSLKGFTVGVKEGDACIEVLHTHGIDSIKKYPAYSAVIAAAASGDVRVFCVDQPPAVYLLNQLGIEKDFRHSVPLYSGEFHRAVRKGDSALLKIVEDGFARISAQEREQIERKWYGSAVAGYGVMHYAGYASYALLGLVLLATVLVLWNWLLRRQVALRTTDIAREQAALRASAQEINNLAFFDPLTQLPNRRMLLDRLPQSMASSTRSGHFCALLFIDLDDFKTLNDTLGHLQGDLLLQQVAQRLLSCVRDDDTVARLGGDEFVVLLEDLSESELLAATQAQGVAEKILEALSQPYELSTQSHRSTPSIGVTLFTGQRERMDDLLKRAELAMYQAKAAGRNAVRFFDPKMQSDVSARAALEADLHQAVLKNQFLLHYQPQVKANGQITGVEALVRWQHPQRGLVPPGEFIALAEETGLILPLGSWVLESACAQLVLWAAQPAMAHLTMAVNVSARQFHQSDYVAQVLAALERTGANPHRLKLELTESLLVTHIEDVIGKMHTLRQTGIGFSLDDFGTGYSSLSYLKRLPLDQLKIDQGFVRDILSDANDAAIAKMVVVLAEAMGLTVIAEGVETQGQRNLLAAQGCHAYQGYLFSRPLPLLAFENFARNQTSETTENL
ncbi:MAG: EAL domain-containing protein [Rhodoferax sp.]|nr:EAL domain-containing protein [Rhodoferax sp.]